MTAYHDFEMGEVVFFKPEYMQANEDPRQAYVVVNAHPESRLIDVRPVGWDFEKSGYLAPVMTYSWRYFMRLGA